MANIAQAANDLIAAAQQGNLEKVETLLISGADPNFSDASGKTPLHHAMDNDSYDVAACLFAYRADHRVADSEGRLALSNSASGLERLHNVRQRYHRFRTRARNAETQPGPAIEQLADNFAQRGIVRIAGFVAPDLLASLKRSFAKFIMELQVKIARGEGIKQHYSEELHLWSGDRALVTNNAFKYSSGLVRLCCDERIIGVADRYLRAAPHIQRGVAMRYLPAESIEREMFGWHHDIEERRVKLMILLTDVGETDQYMSYVTGSHRLYHPYGMFFENNCPLDYCREKLGSLEIDKTIGQAGDAFLFDSNGAHRGNRRPQGAVRDAFFIEYSADNAQVWGGDIDLSALDGIEPWRARAFDRMLAAEKKWSLPPSDSNHPDWLVSLPRIESWL